MMRTASSASSSRTDTHVSPIGLTVNGKSAAGGPEVRTDSMPWLSSSAWTTLASMFEPVRKMTMSSDMVGPPRRQRLDLQQDHRHIVVLIGRPGEGPQVGEDERAQLLERQVRVLLEHFRQPRLAVAVERRRSSSR